MTNKLHPQELADLLQCCVTFDKEGWVGWEKKPTYSNRHDKWFNENLDGNLLYVTHAIVKPDDCPEWDKALWEPRVRPERGQLCIFSNCTEGLNEKYGIIGYFFEMQNDGQFGQFCGCGWSYCKPIDSVPSRIDLDAQKE